MGESAALGDPDPAYGAPRYLQVLLRDRFPALHFEVVNVAITAINSHAIVPIARECAHRQGDLWILYMGNNEMVGPFGAASVFGSQAPPWPYVRLSLELQRTRLGQLLMALAAAFKEKKPSTRQLGRLGNVPRKPRPPDDPRKEIVYRNFQRNLDDILRAGLDSGTKVILNTVAVNLRDCPPLASVSATNLSPANDSATNLHERMQVRTRRAISTKPRNALRRPQTSIPAGRTRSTNGPRASCARPICRSPAALCLGARLRCPARSNRLAHQ
jgi:hypothetical protein